MGDSLGNQNGDGDLKMYIFVNNDLHMTSGKISSQVGHIVHKIVDELVRNGYENFPPSVEYMNYMKWNKNCTKIVLKATEDQLKELLKLSNTRSFYDGNKTTQVPEGSLTVVGFFPCVNIDGINIDNYKLL